MPGRYYIKTFGCQMNEYDSTRMGDVLGAGADLQPTDDPAEADVLLMNTCSVREKAEDKVYSLLGEWRELKKLRPHVLIGVGGCVASQEGEGITKRAPYVDLMRKWLGGPAVLDTNRRSGGAHPVQGKNSFRRGSIRHFLKNAGQAAEEFVPELLSSRAIL